MEAIMWLTAMAVLLGIEVLTLGLTTIWFAGGCFIAFLMAMFGAGVIVQIISFLVVSFVLLFATRPIAMKYLNKGRTKTNADSLIGQRAIVTKSIDNLKAQGEAEVNGQVWTARSELEEQKILEGTVVEICSISGVKLIVRELKEEEAC